MLDHRPRQPPLSTLAQSPPAIANADANVNPSLNANACFNTPSHSVAVPAAPCGGDGIGGAADHLPRPGPAAELEHGAGHGALGEGAVQGKSAARFLVRITSVRVRLLDEDNLCEKYHVDCCRYAGLIPDDAPSLVRIQTLQRKARRGEAEHTQVEIYRLRPDPDPETPPPSDGPAPATTAFSEHQSTLDLR
jgi:hypothetical protein